MKEYKFWDRLYSNSKLGEKREIALYPALTKTLKNAIRYVISGHAFFKINSEAVKDI